MWIDDAAVHRTGDFTCIAAGAIFLALFAALAVKLKDVQLDNSASLAYDGERQSVRSVRMAGERGRILAADGTVLAANLPVREITLDTTAFQKRTWEDTAANMMSAIERAAAVIGRKGDVDLADIEKHIRRKLALPLTVWRNVTDEELARFAEHFELLPGFECEEKLVRTYPQGALAAHAIGYVGRDRMDFGEGERAFHYVDFEMRGRGGLEVRYDSFLRGMPGERNIVVDARGFARDERMVVEPQKGPDLVLALDMALQRACEAQLEGVSGACAVLDPRDGSVLAIASSPAFDLNRFVPSIPKALWDEFAEDPAKRMLNRAISGSYAPGSTFKPVTALAGLKAGLSPRAAYECTGAYRLGKMSIRCSHQWGHWPSVLDMNQALKESCNPYFCDFATRAGTNAVITAARALGLGAKTGIDLPGEAAGVVPDAEWKRLNWHEKWYPGDLPQMAIGQGMLLATPLQMAALAGAIGVGYLAVPHMKAGEQPEVKAIPFAKWQLDTVREGMRSVVKSGTGKRAGAGLAVEVAGKTGTAEVGRGASRRKNVWFIAYAPAKNPTLALAIVIENGDTGGSTAAPRAREILKARFGEAPPGGERSGV